MISIVAARSLPAVEVIGDVYLRTSRVLDYPEVGGLSLTITGSFDSEVDALNLATLDDIVEVLADEASSRDVTYVVPGAGAFGDATVAALPGRLVARLHSFAPDRPSFVRGSCRVVDAAELAIAELSTPFDRGLVPVDPTVPLVVTNWYGQRVTSLATRRLSRIYGNDTLPDPTADFELIIEPVEHLMPAASMAELEQVVARLRRPDGCPWDREQTRESLFPQFVDELQELGEAIGASDVENQREELGDVLFHVIAQSQLAAEAGDYTLDDVLMGITAKLVRRHPHVFGDVVAETYEDVLSTWQRVKAEEKAQVGREQQQ